MSFLWLSCSSFFLHPSSLILHPLNMAERVGFEPTERFPVHSISSAANSTTLAPLQQTQRSDFRDQMSAHESTTDLRLLTSDLQQFMAERVGFEPTVGVNPLRFSRPVH